MYLKIASKVFVVTVSFSKVFSLVSHCQGDAFLLRVSSLWIDCFHWLIYRCIPPVGSQLPSTAPLKIHLKNSSLG